MTQSDDETRDHLEASGPAQHVRDFLTLQSQIESGDLVTEADLEDAARALAEPRDPVEKVATRAATLAKLVTEAGTPTNA
jgi:hypothetical protein